MLRGEESFQLPKGWVPPPRASAAKCGLPDVPWFPFFTISPFFLFLAPRFLFNPPANFGRNLGAAPPLLPCVGIFIAVTLWVRGRLRCEFDWRLWYGPFCTSRCPALSGTSVTPLFPAIQIVPNFFIPPEIFSRLVRGQFRTRLPKMTTPLPPQTSPPPFPLFCCRPHPPHPQARITGTSSEGTLRCRMVI